MPSSLSNPTGQQGMGLGDLLGLAVPAIFGAATGGGIGGAGAGVGAMAGLGAAVGQRQELAKNEADTAYKQALESEAEQQAQTLELKRGELQKQIKSRDDLMADNPDLTIAEKQIIMSDPEKGANLIMQKTARPGLIKMIQMRPPGSTAPPLDADALNKLPYEDLHDIFVAQRKGAQWLPQEVPLPGGGKVSMLVDTSGTHEPKIIHSSSDKAITKEGLETAPDGLQHKIVYSLDPTQKDDKGEMKVLNKFDAGAVKMSAKQTEDAQTAMIALDQADRALNQLGDLPSLSNTKMLEQYAIYNQSKTMGVVREAGQMVGLDIAKLDPTYAKFFATLGQLDATALRAYMKGRPNQVLYDRISQHIPKPGEPQEVVEEKLKALVDEKSNLNEDLRLITGDRHFHEKMLKANSENAGAPGESSKPASPGQSNIPAGAMDVGDGAMLIPMQ